MFHSISSCGQLLNSKLGSALLIFSTFDLQHFIWMFSHSYKLQQNVEAVFVTCCFSEHCGFRFLTSNDEVECDWEVRAAENHYASISFNDFELSKPSGSKLGDCLSIYDGNDWTFVLQLFSFSVFLCFVLFFVHLCGLGFYGMFFCCCFGGGEGCLFICDCLVLR